MVKAFFSSRYNIELPPGHPFPMHKYLALKNLLLEHSIIDACLVADPGAADRETILTVHTAEYYDKMEKGNLSNREQRSLGFPWSPKLFERSMAAVAGTIKATREALNSGLGINLAGGTHHAFPDRGTGYCVFNDIAIACRALTAQVAKILIVDLDAHQGDGTNFILGREENVYTFSAHVGANFPREKFPGTVDIAFERYVKGEIYLKRVKESLEFAIDSFQPELAIFIAGVDVHVDDRFGQMALSTEDVLERDRFTIGLMHREQIPLAIVLGGGYNKAPEMTVALHLATAKTAMEIH